MSLLNGDAVSMSYYINTSLNGTSSVMDCCLNGTSSVMDCCLNASEWGCNDTSSTSTPWSIGDGDNITESNSIPYKPFILEVDFELVKLWRRLFTFGVSLPFSLIGIVCNTLVIAVFYKIGYSDTTNISMTAIGVCDLLRCICELLLVWITFLFQFIRPISPVWAAKLTIPVMHRTLLEFLKDDSATTSIVLIAYVTLQRCLCVTYPLKVKFILTRRSVSWTVGVLTVGSMLISRSAYYPVRLKLLHPLYDLTLSKLNETTMEETLEMINLMIYASFIENRIKLISLILTLSAFVICIVCVVIIYYHLLKASRIASRLQQASVVSDETNHSKRLSKRDVKIVKMLVVIASIYIIAYLPRLWTIYTSFYFLSPSQDPSMRYSNIFVPINYFVEPIIAFEVVNSSINFFIFYNMSTKFNRELKQMICNK